MGPRRPQRQDRPAAADPPVFGRRSDGVAWLGEVLRLRLGLGRP